MKKEGLTVLSLFDGMSCGQIALERAGIKVDRYFASEIDKYAIAVTQKNYPNTIQVGDVTKVRYENGILYTEKGEFEVGEIDLIMGGSPCQGFSFAGKQLNFNDPRSALFFEFVRIKNECNPNYFLLENVRMKQESMDVITFYTGVHPIFINSALVSAQNRQRNYWSNIPGISLPEDKGILLKDILESDLPNCGISGRVVGRRLNEQGLREDYNHNLPIKQYLECRTDEKSNCLTTVSKDSVIPLIKSEERIEIISINDYSSKCQKQIRKNAKTVNQKSIALCTNSNVTGSGVTTIDLGDNIHYRRLTPLECERLQTVPDFYTAWVSNSQRYRMLGNGWTVDVIAHILSNISQLSLSEVA